jgi:hypothetical protein
MNKVTNIRTKVSMWNSFVEEDKRLSVRFFRERKELEVYLQSDKGVFEGSVRVFFSAPETAMAYERIKGGLSISQERYDRVEKEQEALLDDLTAHIKCDDIAEEEPLKTPAAPAPVPTYTPPPIPPVEIVLNNGKVIKVPAHAKMDILAMPKEAALTVKRCGFFHTDEEGYAWAKYVTNVLQKPIPYKELEAMPEFDIPEINIDGNGGEEEPLD